MAFLHPRISRWLALALAMVWVVAVASVDALVTPAMRCHDMPCCPRSDRGMQNCSTAQCAEQVPEKAEGQSVAREPRRSPPAAAVAAATAVDRPSAAPHPEPTGGLRDSAAVFRLKDDLRI